MSSELFDAAVPFLNRLSAHLDQHPDLRAEFIQFARAWTAALERSGSGEIPAYVPPPRPMRPSPYGGPHTYRYGGPEGGSPSYGEIEREPVPLPVMAKRCRLKAEACRILAKRFSADPGEPEDTAPIFKRASELPDCGLWMLTGSGFATVSSVWETLAGAYEAAGAAAELLGIVLPRNDANLELGLNLAAEAQSTLLYAAIDAGRRGPDTDQIELFIRIRETGAQRRIYIPKYLKRDDRADPGNWRDLLARIETALVPLRTGGSAVEAMPQMAAPAKAKPGDKTMVSLRHLLKKAREVPAVAEWGWILKRLDEAVQEGVPPGDPEIRELFLPVIEYVPEEVEIPDGAKQVYREFDRYLTGRPHEDKPAVEVPTAEVRQVANYLGGKEVVLVGGLERPAHKRALTEAFDLANVRWFAATNGVSLAALEADVARPEVAVVLHANRWSSAPDDDVCALCKKYGKILVKLPRGYNCNHVAKEIMVQAGDKLKKK